MEKIGLFWGSNTGNQEEATNFLTDYMKSEDAGGSHLDFGLFLHVKKGTKQRVGDVVDVDVLNVVL